MVKGTVTTWHMTHHMTWHMTRHMTRHMARPRVARPRGGDRVAVAVWRWPCGGHMTCHVTWQDNPLRVTPDAFSQDAFHFLFLLPIHYNGRWPEIALALVRERVVRGAF